MVISILFSLFQSNMKDPIIEVTEILFPYYLVYFKAQDIKIDDLFLRIFPYYLVYFKADLGSNPSNPIS